jgi:hypothetical protein
MAYVKFKADAGLMNCAAKTKAAMVNKTAGV